MPVLNATCENTSHHLSGRSLSEKERDCKELLEEQVSTGLRSLAGVVFGRRAEAAVRTWGGPDTLLRR